MSLEAAVAVADAVIIPVRASIFDIGAITCAVEMCEDRRRPYAFVLSAVNNKMPKLTERGAALISDGLAGRRSYRQDYISALTAGRTAFEVQKDLKGAPKRSISRRSLINGILYVLTTGYQWRQLPKDLPPKSTTDYFVELQCTGVLTRIHHALYAEVRVLEGRAATAKEAL